MMRSALSDAARRAWPNCVYAATAPHAVVDLDSDAKGRIEWVVQYESTLYQQYLRALSSADSLLMDDTSYKGINHRDLIVLYRLPGREGRRLSCAKLRPPCPSRYTS